MAVSQLTTPPSPDAIRRVAFQGDFGAFSEDAVASLWPRATPVPTRSVAEVARAVSRGEADAGVLPVENTVAGGVVAAYDALADAPNLHAIAETILEIRQCLLGVSGATLDTIEVVESHPVALAQCAAFLARLPRVREQAAPDTASAARAVAASGDPRRAAIASTRAAARYGLTILAEHVEDRRDNQTRFLGVARAPVSVAADIPARTSLVFTTANQPGALIRALEPIAAQQLNLSKLESRPTGEPWTYRFFADIDHLAGDPRLDAAIATITQETQTCRLLGTYARALT
jgi:prephenate dehydratase